MTTIFQLLNNKVEIFFFLSPPPSPPRGSLGARTLPWLIKGVGGEATRALYFSEVTTGPKQRG